jgi:ABC-type phosphate transport system substrate-binding protein
MTVKSVRRLAVACAVCAASVAALATPGAASAFTLAPCHGESIDGFGSSLQSIAQKEVWTPEFNVSSVGCPGGPTVTYKSGSSGEALESWGVGGGSANFSSTNAFTATDQPTNTAQAEEIEKNATGGISVGKGTLRTIPVLQAAVAIIVHLPGTCTATSTAAPGRLALSSKTLEKIYQGTAVNWSKIFKSSEGGDEFKNCTKKELKLDPVVRVARAEGSGTTATFKKYLHLVTKGAVESGKDWEQLAEEVPNTLWPNESDKVERGVKGSGIVAKVAEVPGSVGYVNLAEARVTAFEPPAGGENTKFFWVELENNKSAKTYADPSTDFEVVKKAQANCKETTYTNGKKKFPPPHTSEDWNEVTSSTTEKNYTLCGFTYDQAFTHYGDYPGTSEKEARTVFDYMNYVLNEGPEGGQAELSKEHDYLALPTNAIESQNVLNIAQKGAAEVGE